MNLDFHYYGTYVAACAAGYDFNSAQTIAYAAQYVDEFDGSARDQLLTKMRTSGLGEGHRPVKTVETKNVIIEKDILSSKEELVESARIWVPFHFLPGNCRKVDNVIEYTGDKKHDWKEKIIYINVKIDSWEYNDYAKSRFQLLCLPQSTLVKAMVNDTRSHYLNAQHGLHMVGLRMHVLADTWAHQYFAGIPAWFINDAGDAVYDVDKNCKVRWKRISTWKDSVQPEAGRGWGKEFGDEEATPPEASYTGYVYLGHGRMGHLPDYPFLKYRYRPQWSSRDITKNNHAEFLKAMEQMTAALRCIKENRPFEQNSTETLPDGVVNIVKEILGTREGNQSSVWKSGIGNMVLGGRSIKKPEDFDRDTWLSELRSGSSAEKTNCYKFSLSANEHLSFVQKKLLASGVKLDDVYVTQWRRAYEKIPGHTHISIAGNGMVDTGKKVWGLGKKAWGSFKGLF
ncbi:MAG: hypothetical protein GY850_00475 [bacterium]|nr:hypothetical protein [bacterium]